jgi:DNA-binding transcriptional MocR family regulator
MSIDWRSELPIGQGKRYQLLADGLAEAISSGRIEAGSRLPTQRDMALRLGISVSTVTRAYSELRKRGLIQGTVGRGSFARAVPAKRLRRGTRVKKKSEDSNTPMEALEGSLRNTRGLVDLSFNEPLQGLAARCVHRGLADILTAADVKTLAGSQPVTGTAAYRQAGATWLETIGVPAHPDEIVLIPGSQGCLATVLMALCQPGDAILTEALTWPGMIAVARIANVQIRPVGMDAKGLIPDELDRACRDGRPRLLYTMPTLHNPTAITADLERRQAIVAVARRHGIVIVEDDAYGFLPEKPLPSYFELLPDDTIYITSLSKAVAAAIRVGFVASRAQLQRRLLPALRAITMMTSPIVAEVATRLIGSGIAQEAAREQATTLRRRQEIANEILGSATPRGSGPSMHRWFELDPYWDSMSFAAEALRLGVSVAAGAVFSAAPGADPNAVRISLGGEPDEQRVKRALTTLAGLARGHASVRRI